MDSGGNFAATLAMRPVGDAATLALRTFVAALALRDALGALTGRGNLISLKWPNDVLMSGSKVAGILLETGEHGLLCIGIGVNLTGTPDTSALEPRAMTPVSVLDATGIRLTPDELLDALAEAFARWEAQLQTYGFAPLRNSFLDSAARLGEPVTARLPHEEVTGTFSDIDETGAIVLQTPKGARAIPAADIYF